VVVAPEIERGEREREEKRSRNLSRNFQMCFRENSK
jgi:hypothetical protein